MSDFSDEEKLACIEHALSIRRGVYALRVRQGLMSDSQRWREIHLMEAIARDYRARVQPDLALS